MNNKFQDALDNVKKVYVKSDHYDEEDIRLLQKLVDKEIPMKRKKIYDELLFSSYSICPKCNSKVSPICCYCENCGKRLE